MSTTTAPTDNKRRSRRARQDEAVPQATPSQGATAAEPAPAAGPPVNGRHANGRFAAGNPGGSGNPFARQLAQLRAALIQRVTVKDIGEIADALIIKARTGDLAAAKVLLQYVIGKPTEAVNPDTLDVEEYRQIYAPQKEIFTSFSQSMATLPPRTASVLVRELSELRDSQMANFLGLPQEEFVKAGENLDRYFPGIGAPKSPNAGNQSDHVGERDILDELIGPHGPADDEVDDDDVEQPSTHGGNGASGRENADVPPSSNGGNGRERPSINGHNGHKGNGKSAVKEPCPPDTMAQPPSTSGPDRIRSSLPGRRKKR